jgi:HSF-type DNA-binding
MSSESQGPSEPPINEENSTDDASPTRHSQVSASQTQVWPAVELTAVDQGNERFPEKLFRLLDRAEAEGFDRIISWQPHGRCFIVHQREEFKSRLPELLPGMTRWKSFLRQLHIWGFTRITKGRDINSYYHEKFLRYRRHLLRSMRWGDKGTRENSPDKPQSTPDFYMMPFLGPLPLSTGTEDSESASILASESTGLDSMVHAPAGFSTGFSEGMSSREYLESLAATENELDSKPPASTRTGPSRAISISGHESRRGYTHSQVDVGSAIAASQWTLVGTSSAGGGGLGGLQSTADDPHQSIFHASEASSVEFRMMGGTSHDGSDSSQYNEINRRQEQLASAAQSAVELDSELEPRPLPPLTIVQGETIIHVDVQLPVAQHPGFVQIGPQEFVFNERGGTQDEQID